jgi:3,4-dihydroxy 2-butanone 4-phosphate synthase / GTP cyclohydrolase II
MTLRVTYYSNMAALHAAPRTVERVAEARLPTEAGEFRIIGYRSLVSPEEFVALVKGELRPDVPSPVRIHSQCMTGEVFGSLRCDCAGQLGIINKIRAYALQDEGADTIEANERLGLGADLRQYGQCAEILLDVGLRRVRVMSNNPSKVRALEQAGLEVVERLALEVPPTGPASRYLRTKKERMGHLLQLV